MPLLLFLTNNIDCKGRYDSPRKSRNAALFHLIWVVKCTSTVDFGVFATECDTHQDYTPPKTGVVVELCPDWLTQLVQVSYWSVHFQAATNFWLFWFGFVWWHPIVIGSHSDGFTGS